jgi:hypothetical protein
VKIIINTGIIKKNISQKEKKITIPVGLEPTTSGFEGRRAIHCAKGPVVNFVVSLPNKRVVSYLLNFQRKIRQ